MLPIVEMDEKPVYIAEPLYLHVPSGGGKDVKRAEREAAIRQIVSRRSEGACAGAGAGLSSGSVRSSNAGVVSE